MAGHAEILEVFLVHEIPEIDIADALNTQLPMGLTVTNVLEVPAIGKSAAALVQSASYSFSLSKKIGLDSVIQKVMLLDRIEVQKKSKKGMSTVDIRPDIHRLEIVSEQSLQAVLACGSERNLKPEVLARYILKVSGLDGQDCEIDCQRLGIGLKSI
jgi:radical SAM-linked protein